MRRSSWAGVGVFALAMVGMGTAASGACLTANAEGVEVTGVIDTLRGGLKALILRPSVPVCLSGPDQQDNVAETDAVHVYAASDVVMGQLMSAIRTPVHLKGRLFPPSNRLHKAPIVMEVSEVLPGL